MTGCVAGSQVSGDEYPPGDLSVVLPEGSPAGDIRILWSRLDVAVLVKRPRPDRVLPRRGRSPVQRPKCPRELLPWAVELRHPPGGVVDLDLHPRNRCTPRS